MIAQGCRVALIAGFLHRVMVEDIITIMLAETTVIVSAATMIFAADAEVVLRHREYPTPILACFGVCWEGTQVTGA